MLFFYIVIGSGVSGGEKKCLYVWVCIKKEGSRIGIVLFVEVGLLGVGVIAKDWGLEIEKFYTSSCCRGG